MVVQQRYLWLRSGWLWWGCVCRDATSRRRAGGTGPILTQRWHTFTGQLREPICSLLLTETDVCKCCSRLSCWMRSGHGCGSTRALVSQSCCSLQAAARGSRRTRARAGASPWYSGFGRNSVYDRALNIISRTSSCIYATAVACYPCLSWRERGRQPLRGCHRGQRYLRGPMSSAWATSC